MERKEHRDVWTFTTGFPELDEVIHGLERQEELVVLFARINNGKSFVSQKICTHVWQVHQVNVGYLSPEMSANSVGYRFDTLYKGFSNKSLMWGAEGLDEKKYQEYIEDLTSNTNKFLVATPIDFDRVITVSKIKEWIKQNDLKLIIIDGITYLTDERAKRGDNMTTQLTHISEDLMSLSIEMKLPIVVVVQANRGGVVNEEEHKNDMPDLEHIKDSDGMAANASKVLSLRHTKDGILKIYVPKNRFGTVGATLSYEWRPDTGEFIYKLSDVDEMDYEQEETEHKSRKSKKKTETVEDMF
jgi:replicative DNA helicase